MTQNRELEPSEPKEVSKYYSPEDITHVLEGAGYAIKRSEIPAGIWTGNDIIVRWTHLFVARQDGKTIDTTEEINELQADITKTFKEAGVTPDEEYEIHSAGPGVSFASGEEKLSGLYLPRTRFDRDMGTLENTRTITTNVSILGEQDDSARALEAIGIRKGSSAKTGIRTLRESIFVFPCPSEELAQAMTTEGLDQSTNQVERVIALEALPQVMQKELREVYDSYRFPPDNPKKRWRR